MKTSKLKTAYNNQALIDALAPSKQVYEDLLAEMPHLDLDDEQVKAVKRYATLSQFEKDLLYLVSQYKVTEVAELYGVSKTVIYNKLKQLCIY